MKASHPGGVRAPGPGGWLPVHQQSTSHTRTPGDVALLGILTPHARVQGAAVVWMGQWTN